MIIKLTVHSFSGEEKQMVMSLMNWTDATAGTGKYGKTDTKNDESI